jgi:hypothetical protein
VKVQQRTENKIDKVGILCFKITPYLRMQGRQSQEKGEEERAEGLLI